MGQPIPTPESIDAAWLTERLRSAGDPGVEVRGFEARRIGTGQIGQCIRYTLELDGAAADTPRSVIGKFASDDPVSRQTGVTLRNYLKEVRFYQEMRERVSIRTPRCYYAAIEGEGPEFALLLEDMAPGVQGDQLGGCEPAIAEAALLELVGLHAPSWCDPALRGVEWLGEPSSDTLAIGRALYRAQLPGFLKRYGPNLAADEREIIEAVANSKGPPFELLGPVFSLVHVDYRLDNLLIDASQTPPAVTTVDWQSITLGHPLSDVAYFLGAGLLPDTRRRAEPDLVRSYHRALLAGGVSDYAWELCWDDYRRGVFAGFAVTVIASMMVVETERGNEMFTAMARRHSRHAIDLASHEFLG